MPLSCVRGDLVVRKPKGRPPLRRLPLSPLRCRGLFAFRGVGLRCLDQPIDTTMPVGKLVFTILAAVAEFERALIIERTQQGLAAVRARGNLEGRPKSYAPETATAVLALQAAGQSMTDIATVCKISRRTAYRIVEDAATVV